MTKNLALKLFSLLVATLLAVYVHQQNRNSIVSFIVPIEVQNIKDEKIILSPADPQARITIRGPSHLIAKIVAAPPVLKVKIPDDNKSNNYELPLNPNSLNIASPTEVVGIEPSILQLILDDRVEKMVKVKVPTIGEINKNLELKEMAIEPARVKISGPQTKLLKIAEVETSPIDLRNVSESTVVDVMVVVPDAFSKIDKTNVKVKFQIQSRTAEREFKNVELEVRAPSGGEYSVKPGKVAVELSGPIEEVDVLTREDLLPFVRIKEHFSGSQELEVDLDLKDGMSIIYINPKKVSVTRTKSSETTKKQADKKKK